MFHSIHFFLGISISSLVSGIMVDTSNPSKGSASDASTATCTDPKNPKKYPPKYLSCCSTDCFLIEFLVSAFSHSIDQIHEKNIMLIAILNDEEHFWKRICDYPKWPKNFIACCEMGVSSNQWFVHFWTIPSYCIANTEEEISDRKELRVGHHRPRFKWQSVGIPCLGRNLRYSERLCGMASETWCFEKWQRRWQRRWQRKWQRKLLHNRRWWELYLNKNNDLKIIRRQ